MQKQSKNLKDSSEPLEENKELIPEEAVDSNSTELLQGIGLENSEAESLDGSIQPSHEQGKISALSKPRHESETETLINHLEENKAQAIAVEPLFETLVVDHGSKESVQVNNDGIPIGRPTVMTDNVLALLRQAFSMDSTIQEACAHAGISRNSYYEYLKKYPEFQDTVEALRQKPMLAARTSIISGLSNPDFALKYAERKAKSEFSIRTEQTGANGAPLAITLVSYADSTEQLPAETLPDSTTESV